jgi:hypothetical protein
MAFTLAALVVAGVAPAGALALPPAACAPAPDAIPAPVPPDTLSDTDRVVRELRELRREGAATCAAVSDRLDVSEATAVGSASDLAAIRSVGHGDALLARDDSAAVVTAIEDLAASSTTSVAFSAADTARFEATRYGVWFLAGLGCVGLLMPAIRKYWP